MKTFTNVTRYACDHCGREYKASRFVPNHEKSCKKNPANEIACIGCAFLEKVNKDVYIDTWDGERKLTLEGFRCKKRSVGLYPPKVLHSSMLDRYPETFDDEECMPNECELHSFEDTFQ